MAKKDDDDPIVSDLRIRAYIASVIGGTRAPYGQKKFHPFVAGQTQLLVENSTRDKVVRVTVSRSAADILAAGVAVVATFTQTNGSASSSDFAVFFAAANSFPFILYPGESLSLQMAAAAQVVTAQETY